MAQTRRRWGFYAVLAVIGLLEVAVALYIYNVVVAARQGTLGENVGTGADYPPSDAPYPVGTPGATELFIVNSGSGPVAFVPYETNDGNGQDCPVRWQAERATFRDPCLGAAYTLDGRRCDGPANRNLDQYQLEIVNEQVWVNRNDVIPGALSTPASGGTLGPTCPVPPASQTN
jgi:hypothetical protein